MGDNIDTTPKRAVPAYSINLKESHRALKELDDESYMRWRQAQTFFAGGDNKENIEPGILAAEFARRSQDARDLRMAAIAKRLGFETVKQ